MRYAIRLMLIPICYVGVGSVGLVPTSLYGHAISPEEIQKIRAKYGAAIPVSSVTPIVAQSVPAQSNIKGQASPKPVDASGKDEAADVFGLFAPKVRVRKENGFLYIESNGLPSHSMMVGITAWQQQVPLPQPYTGDNAWRIPLQPVPAKQPQTIRDHFLRGAIALAANGIPIFNPQNNRGEISQEIGELDQWGGHCGLADDYHYHVAPLHLQAVLGKGRPIAYALDGYPIYGLTEPDGTAPANLDVCNGHTTNQLGYHYHASLKYPYVNGGFHGEVIELQNQVDPQPRARPIRQGQPPLRGAQITGFKADAEEKSFSLQYMLNAKPASIHYGLLADGKWKFQFVGVDGVTREESYGVNERKERKDARGEKSGERGPNGGRPPKQPLAEEVKEETPLFVPKRTGQMQLSSSAVSAGGVLGIEYTGDGAGISPPVEWKGAPAGTKSYALVMHHLDPEGKVKCYWVLHHIPSDLRTLPQNAQGIGVFGVNSINDRAGYAPPHSKGPGAKTYILTIYALSGEPKLGGAGARVNRAVLLEAIKDQVIDSAELKVVYSRP